MTEACINCAHYYMESGRVWDEYTEESESVGCGAGQYDHTLDESESIIKHQRKVLAHGCPHFKAYTEETR